MKRKYFTTTDNFACALVPLSQNDGTLFMMREANKGFNNRCCYLFEVDGEYFERLSNISDSEVSREELINDYCMDGMKHGMSKLAATWAYGGYSFDTWYDHHNGNRGCSGWVMDKPKDLLRALYEALPTVPEVGTPATIIYYSDKRGVTITEVIKRKNGKVYKVGVKHNAYKYITDAYDGECKCDPDKFWNDEVEYFTLRKNGGWYAEHEPKQYGSVQLAIGYRRTYLDPSF